MSCDAGGKRQGLTLRFFAGLLLTQGAGRLLPLGIIVFAVMSVPAVIAAKVGAYFGGRRILVGTL